METSVIFYLWSLRALAPTKRARPAYTDSRPGVSVFETPNPKLPAPKHRGLSPRQCPRLSGEQDAHVQVRLNKRFLVFASGLPALRAPCAPALVLRARSAWVVLVALGQKSRKSRDRRGSWAGRFDAAPLLATICTAWSY